MRNDHR